MRTRLLHRTREVYGQGVIEAVIWEVPEPVQPSAHRIKYRLAYVVRGRRVVGYDNERGKGDHRHIGRTQRPYAFTDVPTLLADFLRDVKECQS